MKVDYIETCNCDPAIHENSMVSKSLFFVDLGHYIILDQQLRTGS
jgi:hypothetical protein